MRHLNWDEIWQFAEEANHQEKEWMTAHVTECGLCNRRLRTAVRANRAVVTSFQSGVPAASPEHTEQVMQQLRCVKIEGPIANQRNRKPLAIVAASVSAAAIIFAAVGVQMHLHAARQSPSSAILMAVMNGPAQSAAISSGSTSGTAAGVTPKAESSTDSAASVARVNGSIEVTVRNGRGEPVGAANVAFVDAGRVVKIARTDSGGTTAHVVLTGSLNEPYAVRAGTTPSIQPQLTLVVWKAGYQPVVIYNVAVSTSGGPNQKNLVLRPATTADPTVHVADDRAGAPTPSIADAEAVLKLAQSAATTPDNARS